MSQLTMASVPGFFDQDNSAIAAGQALTDDALVKISSNAKGGWTRNERFFLGFFHNGDTVPTPVSPVDNYGYVCAECQFEYFMFSSQAPDPSFVPGQATKPALAPNVTGGAQILALGCDIDDASGLLSCYVYYYDKGGAQTNTHDGVYKVYVTGQRLSVNQSN